MSVTRVNPHPLLALGAVLVVAWVVAPLSSSPPPQAVVERPAAPSPEPTAPEIDEINREVDRLRDRLAEPTRAVEPSRDPFQFVESRADRAATPRHAEAPSVVAAEPPRAIIVWPSLVAILSSGTDAAPSHRAVLEDVSELVQFRSTGEAMGDIVVTAIAADQVTLTHVPSGESTQLTLR